MASGETREDSAAREALAVRMNQEGRVRVIWSAPYGQVLNYANNLSEIAVTAGHPNKEIHEAEYAFVMSVVQARISTENARATADLVGVTNKLVWLTGLLAVATTVAAVIGLLR